MMFYRSLPELKCYICHRHCDQQAWPLWSKYCSAWQSLEFTINGLHSNYCVSSDILYTEKARKVFLYGKGHKIKKGEILPQYTISPQIGRTSVHIRNLKEIANLNKDLVLGDPPPPSLMVKYHTFPFFLNFETLPLVSSFVSS